MSDRSTVWKVLHGAPPTPPPARRDPDRNAGHQQKQAAAAATAASQSPYPHQQHTMGLSSSAVSLQLSPTLQHSTSGLHQHHQHSMSMDDAALLHHQHPGFPGGDLQQQMHMQQQGSPNKQAWPSLSSPKGQGSPAGSPWGRLPAVPTASSPELEPRNQVCTLCSCLLLQSSSTGSWKAKP